MSMVDLPNLFIYLYAQYFANVKRESFFFLFNGFCRKFNENFILFVDIDIEKLGLIKFL